MRMAARKHEEAMDLPFEKVESCIQREKRKRPMLRLNMSFSLAVHLPMRWIALLLYLFK